MNNSGRIYEVESQNTSRNLPKTTKALCCLHYNFRQGHVHKWVGCVGGCSHARYMSVQAINVKLLIRLVDIRFESLLEHRLHVIRFICVFLSPSTHIPTQYLKTAHDRVLPSPLKFSKQLSYSSTVYKVLYYILYSYRINTFILLQDSYMRKCALFIS
jgi:hypothetical protein